MSVIVQNVVSGSSLQSRRGTKRPAEDPPAHYNPCSKHPPVPPTSTAARSNDRPDDSSGDELSDDEADQQESDIDSDVEQTFSAILNKTKRNFSPSPSESSKL